MLARALMHAEKSIGGLTKDFSTKESRPDFQGSGANASEREEQDYDNSAVAISIGHTIIDASQNWSKVFGKAEADEDPHDAQDEDQKREGPYHITLSMHVMLILFMHLILLRYDRCGSIIR